MLVNKLSGIANEKPKNQMAAQIIGNTIGSLAETGPQDLAMPMQLGGPVKKGFVRLYRGQTKELDSSFNKSISGNVETGRWFTTDPGLARFFGKHIYYVDVPEDIAASSIVSDSVFNKSGRLLPEEYSRNVKKLLEEVPLPRE